MKQLTNHDIWRIALEQSAIDCHCTPEDFFRSEAVITRSRQDDRARRYLPLPFECDLVSYGSNVVAQVSERMERVTADYLRDRSPERCFETPQLHLLEEAARPYGLQVCFMAEYFLPDVDALKEHPCSYELRVLHKEDFAPLYLPQWSNALCETRKELDVLGVGAYDGDTLVGFAACSADCEDMWQIGVDVLPHYRRQGIAAAVTSRLAMEILARGKVPFYCAAWCNIPSVRNAVKCGFRPAWAEITARDKAFVNKMNEI